MFLEIFLASIVGGVCSLVGGAILLWRENFARKISLLLVSFAAGSLIGAAFLELLPEAFEALDPEKAGVMAILGILAIFLFEKWLRWYHCHDQDHCEVHSFSKTVLFGDSLHNFIDGIVIALSFSAGTAAGIATTIAVFFHEIPQEIGDFGVLLHAGYKRGKVFLYNLLSATMTPIGAVTGFFLLDAVSGYIGWLLAFATGSFIYIAVSDLLPELRHRGKGIDPGHVITIAAGVLAIWLVGVFFHE